MVHQYLPNFYDVLFTLIIVVFFVVYTLFGYIPDNLKPDKLPKEPTQDEEYVLIRQGMEKCNNLHFMHEYYTAILAYRQKYPDSKIDVKILLEQYDSKCSRF